jgi:ankyrin repeat protein
VGVSKPSSWLVETTQVEACLRLQALGIYIDAHPADGGTGLHEAILWNHPGVVQALLEHGASVMIRYGRWQATALDFASYNGRLECVQILLERGASGRDISADLDEALVSAASQDHIDVARLLCNTGADRQRALAQARRLGLDDMVSLLSTT